jgi:hypothetical protein
LCRGSPSCESGVLVGGVKRKGGGELLFFCAERGGFEVVWLCGRIRPHGGGRYLVVRWDVAALMDVEVG